MFCTNCGTGISNDANFCASCGAETANAVNARLQDAAYRAPRRLTRLTYDKKIAGVCSGIGKYFGVDPTLVRLITAALAVGSCGLAGFAYIAAWIIVPLEYNVPALPPGIPAAI